MEPCCQPCVVDSRSCDPINRTDKIESLKFVLSAFPFGVQPIRTENLITNLHKMRLLETSVILCVLFYFSLAMVAPGKSNSQTGLVGSQVAVGENACTCTRTYEWLRVPIALHSVGVTFLHPYGYNGFRCEMTTHRSCRAQNIRLDCLQSGKTRQT